MSNFAYAFFLLPKAQRSALHAFYQFCRSVDDITDGQLSPFHAKEQLDIWHEEIDLLYKGCATKPEAIAMTDLVNQYHIDPVLLHEIIDGVAMDLTVNEYERFDDLLIYCYKVASAVGLVTIEIFGYQHEATRLFAKYLGIALQLTNIIRDVGEDIDRDRLYLPKEDLEHFDVLKSEIIKKKQTPAFTSLMRFQAQRAGQWYQKAYKMLPPEDISTLAPAIAMGNIYHKLLTKIVDRQFPVLTQRVELPAMQKIWIVLATWINSRKNSKKNKKTRQRK